MTRCSAGTVVGTGSVGDTGSGTGIGTGFAGPPSYRNPSVGRGAGMWSGADAAEQNGVVAADGRRGDHQSDGQPRDHPAWCVRHGVLRVWLDHLTQTAPL